MAKQPPPSGVSPNTTGGDEPPRPLGEHGRALWKSVMAEYGISDIGGRELLAQVCAAEDRAEQLSACIAEDGPVIYTKAGPRANPAVKDELACRAFICRTLARLGLSVEAVKPPGRPSYGFGWQGD